MSYNMDMKKIFWTILIATFVLVSLFAFTACGGAKPTKLTVTQAPDTIKVVQGQEADFSGGLVEVEFDDGSTKEFPMSEMSVKGLKTDVLGTQTVALSYTLRGKTVSTTIDLTVVAPKVTALSLDTEGVKVSYVEGEVFNKQGLVVTATYQTGETGVVPNYDIFPQTLSATTTAVRITYRGVSAEIPVTVAAHAPVSMTLTDTPTKTRYFVGEDFSSEGISALVTYNDGTEETFDAAALRFYHSYGSEYNGPISEQDNVVSVIASTKYGTIQTTLRLTVLAVEPIRLTVTMNGTLEFLEGALFDFDSDNETVSVFVEYNNGVEETLVGSFDSFAYGGEPLALGQTAVTIWLTGFSTVTTAVPVTVSAASVTSVSVLTLPTKTDYHAGESVDLTGLVLQLRLSNGRYSQLAYSEGCGITSATATVGDDQTRITVNYLGFSASFEISVAA